eukprot:comp22337_c0_seq1/m.33219 comp22337_c0_seq1/g.33219  ORF comp22337_c0_seq1/g.33219 comp22337_c0_seq1/m.33219 type:complete len:298 (-) comp22337_c0_seq1:454-1347(-)
MSLVSLSPYEQAYLLAGIDAGIRADGRARTQYRHFTLETGVLSHTHGSARLQLAATDVLVGVKAELGEPLADTPDQGRVLFSVDCSASASPAFEGRGGEVLSTEIARALTRLVEGGKALDLQSLCVIKGKQCWILYVDAVVLVHGGNLLDAISFAVKAALFNTRIPKIKLVEGDDDEPIDIELDDDPSACVPLDTSRLPVIITLTKIGARHIVDATMEEEACMMARLFVGVDGDGNLCLLQKGGFGGVDPGALYEMVESGRRIGKEMIAALDRALERETKLQGTAAGTKLGFLSTGH